MIENYLRQSWTNKEWIIVVNKNDVNMKRYQQLTAHIENVRIFQLPEYYTLGYCLNFASAKAKHPYIAKMDDDEYYAANYLKGMMQALQKSKADVVGKRAYFIYLSGKKTLIQRFFAENRFVRFLAGGTLVYKKEVWKKVKFAHRSLGEDVLFCRTCRQKGFKLFAGDRYNFCAIRRKQPNSHTWKKSDREFLSHPQTKIIAKTNNFKRFVIR